MRNLPLFAAAIAALALPACSTLRQPAHMVPPAYGTDWRAIATDADRARLRDWRPTFVAALAAARAAGHGAQIDAAGTLLAPDAALPDAALPDGMYRCRIVKLGAKQPGLLDYVDYPFFRCSVETQGALKKLAKISGSQRVVGMVFPDSAMRQVLLGSLVLGDEGRAMPYGGDDMRDVAGFIERVGPARWRLVMPRPQFESQLDVMELVPEKQ